MGRELRQSHGEPFKYLHIPIDDAEGEDLVSKLPEAFAFIDEGIATGGFPAPLASARPIQNAWPGCGAGGKARESLGGRVRARRLGGWHNLPNISGQLA